MDTEIEELKQEIRKIEQRIEELKQEIREIEQRIEDVEGQIEDVEGRIDVAEGHLTRADTDGDVSYWRKEKARLQRKKKRLRRTEKRLRRNEESLCREKEQLQTEVQKEKEHLRTEVQKEKEHLREKELVLLKAANPGLSLGVPEKLLQEFTEFMAMQKAKYKSKKSVHLSSESRSIWERAPAINARPHGEVKDLQFIKNRRMYEPLGGNMKDLVGVLPEEEILDARIQLGVQQLQRLLHKPLFSGVPDLVSGAPVVDVSLPLSM